MSSLFTQFIVISFYNLSILALNSLLSRGVSIIEIIQASLTALGSIATLFILSKLMGNREMSQLSIFDYINSITIGSIAAEMATCEFTDLLKPFTAMIVFGLINILLSILTNKFIKVRRLLTDKPSILYDNGQLYYKAFVKAKMDLGEFLAQCRVGGYFNLADIQTAILEPNGKISFLPVAHKRAITGKDLNIFPSQDYLVANVILDGQILEENLKHIGNNKEWLIKQLNIQDISNIAEVLLATCDRNHNLCIYKKLNNKVPQDLLV